MISFPNCKINLGLHVLRKRTDGYHDLETVFYPLPFTDILEIIPSPDQNTGIQFHSTGVAVTGEAADNLCVKAYHLLKKDFPSLPVVHMHLHKTIPAGAGLGGGSADAAFTIKMLDAMAGLQLKNQAMQQYAAQLGSDCPFFIMNKPCYATGRGEELQEISLDLGAYTFILVNPGIHVDTRTAFGGILPAQPDYSLKEMINRPVTEWKSFLQNDFEKTVFLQYPEIAAIKETLYSRGAVFAAMSGSGSTVYGLFEKGHDPALSFPQNYFCKVIPGKEA